MTIKQQGGIFGRNPTFNDVEATDLTVNGIVDATSATTTLGTNTVIQTADSGVGPSSVANELMVENADNAGITIATPDNKAGAIFFGKPTGAAMGRLQFNHDGSGGYMRFFTNNSEAARFTAAGHLDMTNGHDGNIILASGAGIDFSATSGTGTSELFDDYEEGTYTPTVTPQTSGSFTLVSSNDTAAYTKIGRQVTASGQIRIDAPTSPVGTYVDISLPFTVASLPEAASYGGAYIEIGSSQTMTVTQPGLAVFRCYIDASTISGGTYIAYTITFPAA
jgi:hypothetical protein